MKAQTIAVKPLHEKSLAATITQIDDPAEWHPRCLKRCPFAKTHVSEQGDFYYRAPHAHFCQNTIPAGIQYSEGDAQLQLHTEQEET